MNKYFLLIFTMGILSLISSCDPNKNDVIVNNQDYKDINLKEFNKFNLKFINFKIYNTIWDINPHSGNAYPSSQIDTMNVEINSLKKTKELLSFNQKDSIFTYEYLMLNTSNSKLYLILDIDFDKQIIKKLTLTYYEDLYISSLNSKTNFTTGMKNLKFKILNDSTIYSNIKANDLKEAFDGYSDYQKTKHSINDYYDYVSDSNGYFKFDGKEEFEFTFSK